MISISQAISAARLLLKETSPTALMDSQVLLCHVLQCNTAYLATWPEKTLDTKAEDSFHALVKKRLTGIPVAYLIGEREFWSLKLKVSEDTLIPRPETELLVETVLDMFQHKKQLNLVDLGTGSGAIAIALANERPDWQITATDISENALNVSRENAQQHNINNVTFVRSNWFDSLNNQFDVVISNPPYIAETDHHLNQGDIRFEPQSALVSGHMGMDDILKITKQSISHLNNDGWLFLEHGYDQETLVFECLKNVGFSHIKQINDLSGNPRLTIGQSKNH